MGSQKNEICVLCGVNLATTRDHIPPQGFFKGSKAGLQLITVPACSECNNGASQSDEWLRALLSLEAGKQTIAATALWEQGALKSLRRNTRLRKELAKRIFPVINPSTGEAGLAFTLPVNLAESVMGRIVRGLHFFHTGRILRRDVEIAVSKLVYPVDINGSELALLHSGEVGGDAFRYRWSTAVENEEAGLWVLQFHGNVTYCVETGACIEK